MTFYLRLGMLVLKRGVNTPVVFEDVFFEFALESKNLTCIDFSVWIHCDEVSSFSMLDWYDSQADGDQIEHATWVGFVFVSSNDDFGFRWFLGLNRGTYWWKDHHSIGAYKEISRIDSPGEFWQLWAAALKKTKIIKKSHFSILLWSLKIDNLLTFGFVVNWGFSLQGKTLASFAHWKNERK